MSTLETALAIVFVVWNFAGCIIFGEFYGGYCSIQSKTWKLCLLSLLCGPFITLGFLIYNSRFQIMALLYQLGDWTEK